MRKLPLAIFGLALLCLSQASGKQPGNGGNQANGAKPETYPATYYFYCSGVGRGSATGSVYFSSVFSREIDSRLSLVNTNFNGPFAIYLTKTFGASAFTGCPAWRSKDDAVNDKKKSEASFGVKAKIVETEWAGG